MKSWSAAVATVLLVSACASAPGGTTSVVNVHVQNNLIPPGPVTIYMVPESGLERMLGTIPSGTRTLQYKGLPPVGTQRLVARTTDGRNIISNAFVMDGVLALEWSLGTNLVRITQTRGS